METINVPIKEVIHVHSGQYHAYGDSFSVWDIILEEGVELTPEEILPYCFAELSKRKVQSKSDWNYRFLKCYCTHKFDILYVRGGD